MRRIQAIAMFTMTLAMGSGCAHLSRTERGAATGGTIGALAGAAIGGDHGRAGTGAAIGGLTGAALGAAMGNAADEDERRVQAIAAAENAPVNGPLTLEEVADMARRGIGDDVIRTQVRTSGTRYNLSPSQIAWLHDNGVSDGVITEMQNTAYRWPRSTHVRHVYEPVYVMPAPPPRPRIYGPTVGIGFGLYR